MTIFAVTSFLNGLQYSSSCVLKNVDLFLTNTTSFKRGKEIYMQLSSTISLFVLFISYHIYANFRSAFLQVIWQNMSAKDAS